MKLRPIVPIKKEPKPKVAILSINVSGVMTLNPIAVERYGLDEDSHVVIVHDDDSPGNFYMVITQNTDMVKLKRAGKNSLKANYGTAFKEILAFYKLPHQSIKIQMAGAIATEHGPEIYLVTAPLKDLIDKS